MLARLGILSDTHLPKGSYALPKVLLRAFEDVDAILHGGDIVELATLKPLTDIAPVYAVAGNNDPDSVAARCGFRRALRWRGWRIGLVHGDQPPGRNTPERARNAFRTPPPMWEQISNTTRKPGPLPETRVAVPAGRPLEASLPAPGAGVVDCIVFGHSHQPFCALVDGTLMLNPGSPTERRREPRASFAVLETGDGILHARLLYI